MKRVLAFLCFVILLAGCAEKVPSGKNVIRYSAPGFIRYNEIREDIGKDFEKDNPGMRTYYEPITGAAYFEKIQTQIAGGTEPDVFFMRDFELPIFVSKGALLSLDQFIQDDKDFKANDIHRILIDSYSMDGKVYGLPGSFTTGVIFYNKDLFAQAGINPPLASLSWNQILDLAKKLTVREKLSQGDQVNEVVKQFGLVLEYYDWITFIWQNGGKIFTPDKKRCIISSGKAVTAINFLKSLFSKYRVMPSGADLQQSEAYQLFMSGRAAMFTGGRWYTTIFNDIKEFKWGIFPFFHQARKATRLDSHAWVISKRTKNPKLAWEFLKYLTSKEGNWKMVEVGDSVPTHKSNIERFLKMNPENKVYTDSLSFSYTVDKVMSPYIPWRQMQRIINEEFDKFIYGKVGAQKTLKNIEDRINSTINENLKEM
ncbi:MAG: sugar ABC transporter substrate-binding protein [Spirochaetes bacterium]|nr:sugar ABC transporter substrate-binding protein [Spirochaetota bacterium]